MLQVIFGDDEHTAAEGPYVRVLKTRKWLYLISLASVAVGSSLYDPKATKDLLKIVSLPTHTLEIALALGIFYLGLQYLLLVGQLISTYDIVLDERLTFRRAEELASATDRENTARKDYEASLANVSTPDMEGLIYELQKIDQALPRARSLVESLESKAETHKDETDEVKRDFKASRLMMAQRDLQTLESRRTHLTAQVPEFTSKMDRSADPSCIAAKEHLDKATNDRVRLVRQSPALRPGYVFLERVIDTARILPPFGIAVYAIVVLCR